MPARTRSTPICLIVLATVSCAPARTTQAQFEAANLSASNGRFREAIIEYRRVLQAEPRHAQARLKLAELYDRLEDLPSAYHEYVRAADLLPDDLPLQLKTGRFLLLDGRFEEAGARARAVLVRDDRNIDARILLARTLAGQRKIDAALAHLRETTAIDPHRADAYIDIGYLEQQRGRSREAKAAFQEAVRAEPHAVAPRLALAGLLFGEHGTAEAEAALREALQIDVRDVRANLAIATFYLRTGRATEAETYLKRAAANDASAGSRFAIADYYTLTGRYSEAEAALVRLTQEDTTRVAARIRIAGLRFVQGRRDEAYAVIDEVLQSRRARAAALFTRGGFRLAERKLHEAISDLEESVAIDPQAIDSRLQLGAAHVAVGDLSAAIDEYTRVLNLDPKATAAQYQLARLHLASGDARRAVEYARQAARATGSPFDVRLLLARSLIANIDTNAATAELRVLLDQRPDSAAARAMMGTLLGIEGHPSAARTWFDEALKIDPTNLESTLGLANIDAQANRPDAARARIETRVAMTPNDASVLYIAGVALARVGDIDGAERRLRDAIDADPALVDAYEQLGRLYLSEHRLEEAQAQFSAALQRRPSSVSGRTMLGVILEIRGRSSEAERAYEQVLEANPTAAVAANNLAWLYAERGANLDVALRRAQEAKRQLTDNPKVNDTLGWVYYKKGMISEAVTALCESIDRDPSDPQAQFHAGLALLKNGDLLRARQALERALALDANFENAADTRAALSRLGSS